jgi:hypothetical protein
MRKRAKPTLISRPKNAPIVGGFDSEVQCTNTLSVDLVSCVRQSTVMPRRNGVTVFVVETKSMLLIGTIGATFVQVVM